MKLIDTTNYDYGSCIDIVKFKSRSLIELCFENTMNKQFPCVLLQLGPSDVFYFSIGVYRYVATLTIWGRHYDD